MTRTRGPLATAAAMSGASIPGWFGLKPQSPQDAATTYFDGGALPAGWSAFNPGSLTSVAVTDDERLKVTQATHAGQGIGGAVRAAPAYTDYCLTACLAARGKVVDFGAYGIVLGGSDTLSGPATARLLLFNNTLLTGPGGGVTAAVQCECNTYVRYNLIDTAHGKLAGKTYRYLRVFFTTASLGSFSLLGSDDGDEWALLFGLNQGAANLGGASEVPSYVGIFVNNLATGVDLVCLSPMFRVDSTADMFLPCGGYLG